MGSSSQLIETSAKRSLRIDSLTSLRFFAASLIVMQHTLPERFVAPGAPLHEFPFDHGVSFFFVLSGFILTLVYPKLNSRRTLGKYFVARVARLWPAHVCALVLAIGAYRIQPTIWSLLRNTTMIHAWFPFSASYFSYNMASWSISTELGLYILFPLLLHRLGQTWHWKLTMTLLLVVGLIAISCLLKLPGFAGLDDDQVSYHGLLYVSPLARLLEFTVGMTTCLHFLKVRDRLKGGTMMWTALEALTLSLVLFNMTQHAFFQELALNYLGAPAKEYVTHTSSLLTIPLLLFVFACERGLICRLLGSWGIVFLGEISFSVYLFHQPLFRLAGGQLSYRLFLATLLLAAAAVYRLVEVPSRQAIVRLASRWSP